MAAKLQAKAPAEAGAWRVRSRLAARACGQATAAVFWLLGRGVRARMNRIMLAHGLVELANAFGTLAACAGLAYEHYRRAGDTRAEAVVLPR